MFLFGKKKKQQEENAIKEAELKVESNAETETESGTEQKEVSRKDMIEVRDAYGRKLYIGKQEWATKVLPNQIKTNWDNPGALYNIILGGIQHDMVEEILEAAERLNDIDPIKERSHVILAIAYMKNGDLQDAEDVLTEYIEAFGKSGVVLTNLAKVYNEQGEEEKCHETLWEALQLDPNQESGLAWWLTIQREKNGQEGYAKALVEACKIPGGYLPQLYRARIFADTKDFAGALEQYDKILKEHGDKQEALLMTSGDMGRVGLVKEMLERVVPLYDVENHDMRIGLNVLQGYLTLRDVENGTGLLNQLMLKNRPDIRPYLLQMSEQFDILKGTKADRPMTEENKMGMLVLEKPVWCYNLANAEFLNLPEKKVGDGRVGFLVYTNTREEQKEGVSAEKEDAMGRLTRNLPLFLQELTYFYSEQNATSLFYVISGKGPVLNGKEWEKETLQHIAKDGKYDCLVTGNMTRKGEAAEVKTMLYRVEEDSITEIVDTLEIQNMGACLMQHIGKVFEAVTGKPLTEQSANCDCYTLPEEKYVYEYMIALAQAFAQTLVAHKAVPKDGLLGERNIMEWYIKLCLSMPGNKQLPVLFASGLGKSKAAESNVYLEYQTQAMELMNKGLQEGTVKEQLVQNVEALYRD